jgi:SAM-dependent methyltransferase
MTDDFANVYEDDARAQAYAGLGYPGTYYLAFRDIPELIARHVSGLSALDFGCGTGRSSRFLQAQGFQVTGVDISAAMLGHARAQDPDGTYLLVPEGDLGELPTGSFDLVLSAFTFDNIPARAVRSRICAEFRRLLAPGGRVVNLVSAPEIYVNEWVSFSTRDFPENRAAGPGDRVRIVMLDVDDARPVEDLLWTDESYRELYQGADLGVVEVHRPLGRPEDPFDWVNEAEVSPWVIYVLG